MTQSQDFDEWAVLEIMGHNRFAGRVMEQSIGGSSFVRIDVPAVGDRQPFTKIFGAGSIYCITPVTEDVARRIALNLTPEPVNRFELKLPTEKQLPLGPAPVGFEDDWS